MTRATRALSGVLACLWLASTTAPGTALAEAKLTVRNRDGAREGFNDPTPAAPVGGNTESTVGAQRLKAVQYAADLWGAALDSDVEIIVDASFDDLPCMTEGAVLGNAAPTTLIGPLEGPDANPDWAYPSALADRLLGMDANPGQADIVAFFNTLDAGACAPHGHWYYGLDGKPGDDADLVQVALHELAHGLGITMLLDTSTGAMLAGMPDPVTAQALDLDTQQTLGEMSDDKRLSALGKPRRVVWSGQAVARAAQDELSHGTLRLATTPSVPGLSGLVSDTNFGAEPLARSASGPLLLGDPLDGGGAVTSQVQGKVMLYQPGVPPDGLAAELALRGALALLIVIPEAYALPPAPIDLPDPQASDLPVASIAASDADALIAAHGERPVTVALSVVAEQAIGTDPEGRMYLNATDPITSSTLGHWDMLARPNLLMEPFERPRASPHSLGLAPAWLSDLGWHPRCGNGQLDTSEGCDDGLGNSDSAPDACRRDCQPARCGDGVRDRGEACDDGADNSNTAANTCRLDCRAPGCGDLVRDDGEACDHGPDGSERCSAACEWLHDCAKADACSGEPAPTGDGDMAQDGDGDGSGPAAFDQGDGRDAGGGSAAATAADVGCGCRLGAARHGPGAPLFAWTLGLGLFWLRKRGQRGRNRRPTRGA